MASHSSKKFPLWNGLLSRSSKQVCTTDMILRVNVSKGNHYITITTTIVPQLPTKQQQNAAQLVQAVMTALCHCGGYWMQTFPNSSLTDTDFGLADLTVSCLIFLLLLCWKGPDLWSGTVTTSPSSGTLSCGSSAPPDSAVSHDWHWTNGQMGKAC